jgi:HlyD family secretion protein
VTRGPVAPYVTASGAVNPVVTVQVGTYVSGVIQELRCDFNTRVRKGQLCAKIDPRPYQTVVDQDSALLATARAQLAKDESNLEFARVIYGSDRQLLERGIISQETLDSADNVFRQAQSQIALDQATISQREAELRAAKVNLEYTDIVSPVDGTVVSRNVTQGQTVAASFQTPTLFVIATDLTKMQVDANVSESDIGSLATGNDTAFTVEAFPNRTFTGRVVQVRQSPQSVQNVVTYDVVSEAANPDLLLKPGMTAAVRIVSAKHDDVLRVPAQALRYWPASAGNVAHTGARTSAEVFVLQAGKPTPVRVTTGLIDDSHVEITDGALKLGEPVIVSERKPAEGGSAPSLAQQAPRVPRF